MKIMTKIYSSNLFGLLMATLLLLGASSCQKEKFVTDTPDQQSGMTPSYGTTYMSLTLDTGNGFIGAMGNRSATTNIEDSEEQWVGDDEFTTFAVYVVSEGNNEVHYIGGTISTPAEYDGWINGEPNKVKDAALHPDIEKWENNKITLKPWKTSPGKKTIYAYLNPPDQYVTWLNEARNNKSEFLNRVKAPIDFQGTEGVTYPSSNKPQLGGFRPDPNIARKVLATKFNDNTLGQVPIDEPTTLPQGYPTSKDSRYYDIEDVKIDVIKFKRYIDHIMCSGTNLEPIVVENGVSEDEAKSGRTNRAKVSVRRVLAQAVVSVDESAFDQGIKGDPEKSKMKLKGLFFQVLNFEPTFFPIAHTTDGNWYKQDNTKSPLYDQTEPTGLINFDTYKPSGDLNSQFDPYTLDYERFFRYAPFYPKSEVTTVGTDMMRRLLHQRVLNKQGQVDGESNQHFWLYPYDTPTVRWGSCYLTETTHEWGAGENSGYRKGNTPFFAIIAAFDITSLPWSTQTEKQIQDFHSEIAEKKAKEMGTKEQDLKNLEDAKAADPLNDQIKAKEEEIKEKKAERKEASMRKPRPKDLIKELTTLINKLEAELKALKKQLNEKYPGISDLKKDIDNVKKKYTLSGYDTGDEVTPLIYTRGINRIYYSLDEQKFYLDYHNIPVERRGGKVHNLQMGDEWLRKLQAKGIPSKGKQNVPDDAAVLEPSPELLKTLTDVMNGDKSSAELTPEEKNSVDFYLYGRVSPGLLKFFNGSRATEYDYIDLRMGYVEDYTAEKKDKVVNYECSIRFRGSSYSIAGSDAKKSTRLLMVYYAWVNPNTNNRATWYSSPVLRNNIYHMHITGFRRMGLSGIPFVKKPTDPRYTYLHNLDPDEKVPKNEEHLPMTDTQMTVQVNNVGWGIHSYRNKL